MQQTNMTWKPENGSAGGKTKKGKMGYTGIQFKDELETKGVTCEDLLLEE